MEDRLKTSLTAAIAEWWDGAGDDHPGVYVGDDLPEIMATAALAVLRGITDAQSYLEANDLLKED